MCWKGDFPAEKIFGFSADACHLGYSCTSVQILRNGSWATFSLRSISSHFHRWWKKVLWKGLFKNIGKKQLFRTLLSHTCIVPTVNVQGSRFIQLGPLPYRRSYSKVQYSFIQCTEYSTNYWKPGFLAVVCREPIERGGSCLVLKRRWMETQRVHVKGVLPWLVR